MAHVDRIWFHGSQLTKQTMKVYIKLKPSGEAVIDVPVPPKFAEVLLNLAQTAADQHEAHMQAEILGERHGQKVQDSVRK